MQGESLALDADVRVTLDDSLRPAPSRAVLARVDELWREQAAARGSALHDGKLFSVSAGSARELRGWFAEYRWWVAQRCDPSLREALGVRPLGVTGLVRAGDATLFGLRSARVLQNPGCWELAPSGGVEPSARGADGALSLVAQVIAEAGEELGLAPASVARAAPFALIVDPRSGVLDAFVELELRMRASELAQLVSRAPREEYEQLACISDRELGAWLERIGDALDPVSRAALAWPREARS